MRGAKKAQELRQEKLIAFGWMIPAALSVFLALFSSRPGVWFDEAATISATSRSWNQLWRLSEHQDRSLVGYYALSKVVADVCECDPLTAARAISTSAYIAATVLVALIAVKLWGQRAGVVAGAAVAILPAAASSPVNARPEGISIFLVGAYFYATLRSRRMLQFTCALLACSMYALNVLYLPLCLLITLLTRQRPTRADLLATATVSALGACWLLDCASQQKQVGWIHTVLTVDFFGSFIRVGASAPTSHTDEPFVTFVSVSLGVALTLIAARMLASHATRVDTAALLTMWTFPPLVACSAAIFGIDIFVERYFAPSVIAIALLVGYSTVHLNMKPRLRNCILAGLATACIPSLISSHAKDGHWGENLHAHQTEILAAGPQRVAFVVPHDRAVLFTGGHLAGPWKNSTWWAQARFDGTLWGPPVSAPAGTRVVVADTRISNQLTGLPGCTLMHRTLIHREPRFTTFSVTCAR